MSIHCGYVVKVQHLRPHANADRLQIASFFGNDTCVGLDIKIGDIGIYFPSDLQLSVEFAEVNNLLRKKDNAGNNIGGYMDPSKRNVCAIRLRGEKSDGLFLPLNCLESFGDISQLKEGDVINVFNGHEICRKYIPRRNIVEYNKQKYGSKIPHKKISIAPLFMEHVDTEQLAYNLDAFKPGDEIEISLKMHGTSQRTGYLPVFKGYKRTFWERITRKEGKPVYEWGYVSGTRRTVLENYDGGYYGSNEFREQHSKFFEGKLWKGETVYYEVVGFTHTGAPIMAKGNNEKLGKDFVRQYGKTTTFSYGCDCAEQAWEENRSQDADKPKSDIYVYRMTMTNEDGAIVEYTPDFMRYRCEQVGVKTVPVFAKVYIKEDAVIAHHADGLYSGGNLPEGVSIGEAVKMIAEKFYDGPDPIGKTHVREGVVVRIINRPKFTAFKHKNFSFKVIEGLIKDIATAPDMEEAQEIENNG